MLFRLRDLIEQHAPLVTFNYQRGVLLFVSLSNGCERAQAHHFFGSDVAQVWAHVLHYPELSIKESFRRISYDGSAAFALVRLYELTQEARWLAMVEKAFNYFIAAEYWKKRDHWFSYCISALIRYQEKEKYYRFGIQNVAGYLDFVANRITTYPTLLELMGAAEQMVDSLSRSESYRHFLDDLDKHAFYQALEKRAHYLLNGYFAPEIAMYFANPQRILGSFFIRHHAFRVRIDDVGHYLSAYVGYLKYLRKKELKNTPIVGMLSYPVRPQNFFEANKIALEAQKQGLSLFYFSYSNNQCAKTVSGYLFTQSGWIKWVDRPPLVIDNAPPRNKKEHSLDTALRKQSYLLFNHLGAKNKVLKILENDLKEKHFLIDYSLAERDTFKALLNRWKTVILKPVRSNRGRNIFKLEYLGGEWQCADMYARVGRARITSNLATGGERVDGKEFLRAHLGIHIYKKVVSELKRAALLVVNTVQQRYEFNIDAIGCDFGLEGEQIFLFEINGYPGLRGCYQTAVPIKVAYYNYLIKKLSLQK